MWGAVKKFWMDLLTEDDANSIFCPVRVIGASGIVTLIGMAIYLGVTKGTFDPMSFGTGVAGIAGATGVGVGAKAKMGA